MANSPSHKFGQYIGNLLEEIIESELKEFCNDRELYLDRVGPRNARNGKKLIKWEDKYGTIHNLDFVIEKDGSDQDIGRPVAFIEAAWRRYTKHSRNKVQEIQGAVLPIFEKHQFELPFIGVALAGIYTQASIDQLESSGFKVLYFPYRTITESFNKIGLNMEFDESTPDSVFEQANSFCSKLTPSEKTKLKKTHD